MNQYFTNKWIKPELHFFLQPARRTRAKIWSRFWAEKGKKLKCKAAIKKKVQKGNRLWKGRVAFGNQPWSEIFLERTGVGFWNESGVKFFLCRKCGQVLWASLRPEEKREEERGDSKKGWRKEKWSEGWRKRSKRSWKVRMVTRRTVERKRKKKGQTRMRQKQR